MLTENLDIFFNDFGVPVIIGASSFVGILDMPDDLIASGMAISTNYQLTMKTTDVENLELNDPVKVKGIDYTVRETFKVDDGEMTKIILSKV